MPNPAVDQTRARNRAAVHFFLGRLTFIAFNLNQVAYEYRKTL